MFLYRLILCGVLMSASCAQDSLVELTLEGGAVCEDRLTQVKCTVVNTTTLSWTLPPFIPDSNPVIISSADELGTTVTRFNVINLEAAITDTTDTGNGRATITSTLSFIANYDVIGKTVSCSDGLSTESLLLSAPDFPQTPRDFTCAPQSCGPSSIQYQCTWTEAPDRFTFTVSADDEVIYQSSVEAGGGGSFEYSLDCGSFVDESYTTFGICGLPLETASNNNADCRVCGQLPGGNGQGIGCMPSFRVLFVAMMVHGLIAAYW